MIYFRDLLIFNCLVDLSHIECLPTSGGSKGAPPAPAPPLGPKIFLISCSFFENLAKLYIVRPMEGWHPSYGESWIRPCLPSFLSHLINNSKCTFPGGKPPLDSVQKILVKLTVDERLLYSVSVVSGFGMVFSFLCIGFNLYYRNTK